jgi:hypothetical protein
MHRVHALLQLTTTPGASVGCAVAAGPRVGAAAGCEAPMQRRSGGVPERHGVCMLCLNRVFACKQWTDSCAGQLVRRRCRARRRHVWAVAGDRFSDGFAGVPERHGRSMPCMHQLCACRQWTASGAGFGAASMSGSEPALPAVARRRCSDGAEACQSGMGCACNVYIACLHASIGRLLALAIWHGVAAGPEVSALRAVAGADAVTVSRPAIAA